MLSLDEPLLIASTRARLSHLKSIFFLERVGPHTTQLKRIDTSSFAIMPIEIQSLGHLYWNQMLANQVPHAHEPDASVSIWQSGMLSLEVRWRKLTPFQYIIKMCHQHKSERKAAGSFFRWDGCLSLAAALYILERNLRPGHTTLVAC